MSRNFQTSDKKDNNKDFSNFKLQESQSCNKCVNGFSKVKKSFEQVCFIRQILKAGLVFLQSPFLLVASNDSFSLELM